MLKTVSSTISVFLFGLALAGCASSAKIEPVAESAVITVTDGKSVKPVQFRKIVVKLKRGEDIGSIQIGLLCAPNNELIYRGGRQTLGGDELTEVFQDELRAANYEVVGDPDALFEDPSTWKAEFLIAGLVKNMKANVCYPMAGFGDYVNGNGEAFMEVQWQIYSRLERNVVYDVTTQGYAKIEDSRPSPDIDIFLDAFAQATRNLLADQGFYDLVAGIQEANESTTSDAFRFISRRPLFSEPIANRINDVRVNVVTVFAGDGHGSGFFIGESGYLITNEHVVRSARFVKLRLATGREVLGEVIEVNKRRDVALLKAEDTGIPGLPIRQDSPDIGSDVYAIGSPLDEQYNLTVSRGIVSAYRNEDGLDLIQSDVNVLPGNSGGPLLDGQGNVIGITAKGVRIGDSMMGLNFFIPISEALKSVGVEIKPVGTI